MIHLKGMIGESHVRMTLQMVNVREKHRVTAEHVVRLQISALCCHFQSNKIAKLGQMFYQTAGYGLGVVYSGPCTALNEMNIGFVNYTGKK